MTRTRSARALLAVVAAGVLLTTSACDGVDSTRSSGDSGSQSPSAGAKSSPSSTSAYQPKKKKKQYPKGPPMLLDSIAPLGHTTVGVAMPISIAFTTPVKPKAHKQIEKHIELTTSVPVKGAWHWFGNQRADFRPRHYWKPGTTVHMVARFNHVGDGFGRYGTHSYFRKFKIGADVRTHVFVNKHKTVVTRNGKTLRTMPSNAGSPEFPSWDGTMAVVNKSRTVRMTSCSVHIACDKSDPNFYDLVLPWDVRITWSGTFLHYSNADPYPGNGYGSHGCVHLSWNDAQWYYSLTKQGDPVTITGSPRGKSPGDNGYADYNVPWNVWLSGSGMKAFTTQT